MKNTNNYKAISSSVVMGALANGDSLNLKPYLIAEMVYNFLDFDPSVSIYENSTLISSTRAFPNPVLTETTIEYQLQNSGRVKVSIFDAQAGLVKTLFEGRQLQGINAVKWNTTNYKDAHVAAPGNYFYLIESGNKRQSGKITVL